MSSRDLLNYRSNIYSQNGEDGVIEEILKRLNLDQMQKWCVEFGAWDGKHLSNTFALVEKDNWNAIYIESSKERYKDLLETAKKYKKVVPLNKFIESDRNHENSLDNILSQTLLPEDYEILSIDIDSYDLSIFSDYRGNPKIVIIEINSSIPPGIFQWHNGKKFFGSSFSSTLAVAKEKNYTLVCHTGNMIFVRNDLIPELNIAESDINFPERLFIDTWINQPQSFISKVKRKLRNFY